ncbi:uncharacterized protein LOC135368343 isoform X2 [Ornithodoros turicata]|uniref:uncharacterized protein LOC135368343 isoform X2 n=1 Tax=Ornithodoros turicata TaxID=34597 RepID=UPI0031392183
MSHNSASRGAEAGIGENSTVACSTLESAKKETADMDAELKALGLWEEDLSEEQKAELLKVVAVSKETAQLEEAVRHCLVHPAWMLKDDTQTHHSPKYMGEEITVDSEEESMPAPPENQRHPSLWPSQSNTVACSTSGGGGGGGEDAYESRSEWDFSASRPAKLRVLAMEHHLSLQWDEGPPELIDKRLAEFPAPGRKFWSTTGSVRNLEGLHAGLKEYQRKLPVRPWCHPVGGRSRHQLSCSALLHSASESQRLSGMVAHPKRPHQEEDDAGGDPSCLTPGDHL